MEMLRIGNTKINKMDVESVDAGEFCKNDFVFLPFSVESAELRWN